MNRKPATTGSPVPPRSPALAKYAGFLQPSDSPPKLSLVYAARRIRRSSCRKRGSARNGSKSGCALSSTML